MKALDELASGEPTSTPAAPRDRGNRAGQRAPRDGAIAMRLVEATMLGTCVLFIATGCSEVSDVAEPDLTGTVSAQTQDATEAEGADATSEKAPPPPAPPKATGALTDSERLFQGDWQLNVYEPDSLSGTLRIDKRDFHADGVHGKYAGYVSIRTDTSPAQVDFTIEDCDCMYKGMTSTGIYFKEDDGAIVFAGPAPGEPRPEAFTEPNDMWRMRPLDPATDRHGEESP